MEKQPFGSIRYNAIGPWLKRRFGERAVKLSLSGGFSCPNRDGTKGTGGCSFCLGGSGEFASAAGPESVAQAMDAQAALLVRKWPDAKYIAYFQSYTETYAPAERLRELWESALARPDVAGLAVATRPDCLGIEAESSDILNLLSEMNSRTFLWVELGLQTARQESADAFNRCFDNSEFEAACRALSARGIRIVVHLILGLPGESREDMLASARYAASFRPFGIKLHMLHLMRGTLMGEAWLREPFPLLSLDEYVGTVCDILEELPRDITVHRLTGDAPKDALIAPDWTGDKHAVLNAVQKELKRRGSFQGCRAGGGQP
ncbi:MAG: TIGR01212 family radical SAM protein [Firmicutes bacterium]|nr:TIGR01212 family radical SAM protein [Bacillota bacterium]